MALNSHVVSSMLFSLVMATALFSAAQGLPGGWTPIQDPKDPTVVEIANFAIDTHNRKAKTNLKFESVIGGQTFPVVGTDYKLVIAAKDGGAENKYETFVWDKPDEKFRQLISFKKL